MKKLLIILILCFSFSIAQDINNPTIVIFLGDSKTDAGITKTFIGLPGSIGFNGSTVDHLYSRAYAGGGDIIIDFRNKGNVVDITTIVSGSGKIRVSLIYITSS